MESTILHVILHFFVPLGVAKAVWRKKWIRPFLIMAITIAVDLDHILADPIFDPNRCSINIHPLHSWPAIVVYLACLLSPNLRIVALGLLIHMALDGTYCLLFL